MRFSRLRALYRRHFRDPRRERLFLASLSFFLTVAVTRLLTHSFRAMVPPFEGVLIGGVHVHHLVWGILILLVVGYCWLIQLGGNSANTGRLLAVLYASGAALTLDEFALWLNLKDVYWEREGRASVDALMMFGGLVSAGLWGGPFLRGLWRQLGRVLRGPWWAGAKIRTHVSRRVRARRLRHPLHDVGPAGLSQEVIKTPQIEPN